MEEEQMKCGGDFDAAMHYDCAECNVKDCPHRKETKYLWYFLILMISLVIIGFIYIFLR